ncbi:hypothetical protein [Streptacidiphilus monticola]|jgi:polyhydroxyalkanoate synthesis regulator phasin|uniref:Heparin-binding hemagglutinin n=1 Tax=Streptacidiphilus monticola TaxID=2161674 RepID=A0ABW1FVT4_9ACTN
MPIADDLRKTLTDPTPLYAIAGAGDAAVEKLKTVPEKAAALAADRKATQEKAQAKLGEAQAKVSEKVTEAVQAVQALPADLRSLQERAQHLALQGVGRAAELAVKAREVYDELAERGKVVVDRGRGETAAEITSKADAFAAAVEPEPEAAPEAEAAAEEPEPKKPAAKRTTPRKATQK